MEFTDYIILNDETDSKERELIARVMTDGFSFGWYRNANSKKTVSDSQFDIGTISPDNAEEILQDRFCAYYVSKLSR